MSSRRCALGCEIMLNFTHTCPGVEDTMCPDSFVMIRDGGIECLEVCKVNGYENGYWLHYTSFTEYFACFDRYKDECDYWKIYRYCSPMNDTVIYTSQILSFLCCFILLVCLRKEIQKGLLQQSLFMANVHNLIQGCISEQSYSVWAMYHMDKSQPEAYVLLILRYTHLWLGILGSLGWSIFAAIVLLQLTSRFQRHYRGVFQCFCACKHLKLHLVVMYEAVLVAMVVVSCLAHLRVWTNFFIVLVILVFLTVAAGFVCYSVPVCRAWRLQKMANAQAIQFPSRAQGKERIRIKPFLLLLFVSLFTYFPALCLSLLPYHTRNLTSEAIVTVCLELVGVWNLCAFCMVVCGKKTSSLYQQVSTTRVFLKTGHGLVFSLPPKRRSLHFIEKIKNMKNKNNNNQRNKNHYQNENISGSHSFFKHLKKTPSFFVMNTEQTRFGSAAGGVGSVIGVNEQMLDKDIIVGDIEQNANGALVRWTKRPGCKPGSLQLAGLPLEKFHLFIDVLVAPLFPQDCLSPLPSGFSLGGIISEKVEEQKLQLAAIEDFEEAVLNWTALHDRVPIFPLHVADGAGGAAAAPSNFEQAQMNWACEEALFKVKETIAVLVRWRRGTTTSVPRSIELKLGPPEIPDELAEPSVCLNNLEPFPTYFPELCGGVSISGDLINFPSEKNDEVAVTTTIMPHTRTTLDTQADSGSDSSGANLIS